MTFTVKVRGRGGLMLAEYMCPEHGRFEALVERDANGDPPSEVRCVSGYAVVGEPPVEVFLGTECGRISPWTISAPPVHTQFVVTASHGKSDPKPHKYSMDTRMLAEGRRKEFRQQRRKIREEERHARLKRFLS